MANDFSVSHPKTAALEALKGTLPPIVPWCHVSKLMSGLVQAKTLHNAASQGDGPESFLVGNKRCSSREAIIDWLAGR